MTPLEFFDGRITGFGAVLGWTGKVARRFEMGLQGQWSHQDRALHMDETCRYDDGEVLTRRWAIHGDEEGVIVGQDMLGALRMRGRSKGRDFQLVLDRRPSGPGGQVRPPLVVDYIEAGPNDRIISGRARLFGLTIATLHIALHREPNL